MMTRRTLLSTLSSTQLVRMRLPLAATCILILLVSLDVAEGVGSPGFV
jgi:hypothetical protein